MKNAVRPLLVVIVTLIVASLVLSTFYLPAE